MLPDLSLKLLLFYEQGMVLALIFLGSFATKDDLTAFWFMMLLQTKSRVLRIWFREFIALKLNQWSI